MAEKTVATEPENMGNEKRTSAIEPCPYCGFTGKLVWVHGHGQCSRCKTNIDECCRGEATVNESGE